MQDLILSFIFLASNSALAGSRCGGLSSQKIQFGDTTFNSTLSMFVGGNCGGGVSISEGGVRRTLSLKDGKPCLEMRVDATSSDLKEEHKKYLARSRETVRCSGLSNCFDAHRKWYDQMSAEIPKLGVNCDKSMLSSCSAVVQEMEADLKGKNFDLLFESSKCQKTTEFCGHELQGWLRQQESSLPPDKQLKFKKRCDLDALSRQDEACTQTAKKMGYGGGPEKELKHCQGDPISGPDAEAMKSALSVKNSEGKIVGEMTLGNGKLVLKSTDTSGKVDSHKPMMVVTRTADKILIQGYSRVGGELVGQTETVISEDCPRARRGTRGGEQEIPPSDLKGKNCSTSDDSGACGSVPKLNCTPLNSSKEVIGSKKDQ